MVMNTSPEEQREAGAGAGAGVPPLPGTPPPYAGAPPTPPPYGVDPRTAAPGWANRWGSALDSRRKSVGLAYFLSFIMPGLGQVYVGYYQRGFVHVAIFAGIITMLASGAARGLEPLLGIFMGFFYFYNIVDAGRRASFYNQALNGMHQMELPEDFKMPGGSGSLVGGVLLTAIGVLLFLHTRWDFDLEFLADWWPLVLVALGINLIYRARTRKGS